MNDTEIAALIAKEAKSGINVGPSYGKKKKNIADVNKQFLVNTVLSLSSHNTREVSISIDFKKDTSKLNTLCSNLFRK